MKKHILLFFIFAVFVSLVPKQVQAVSTNKDKFPFEITSIQIKENAIKIEGWGMLAATHHFNSQNTHYYELKLTSKNDRLTYQSQPLYNSQTETMKVMNVRKCNPKEYYQEGGICYYNYDYVGFSFVIPFHDLKENENYEASLKVISKVLNISDTTYVFYPSLTPVKKVIENLEYKVTTNLYDTSLKVIAHSVFERLNPNKYSKIRQSNKICSYTYGYNRYFKDQSSYAHVYDRKINENTTYYKVSTSKDTSCVDGKNVVIEGNAYYSWIASNWVDFLGDTLTLSVTDINQAPQITIIENPTISIQQANEFNFKNYATAYDVEDGDITHKIIQTNQVQMSKEGIYRYELEVEDRYGKKDHKPLIVTVVKENVPPVIEAFDQTIYQYESFNYLKDVQAMDEEDGNISNKLTYSGLVDSEKIGIYPVTYQVKDSNHALTSKTILVSVIKNPRENIRYIAHHSSYLFYKQAIPKNWMKRIEYLKEQIDHPKNILTKKFYLK